MSLYAKRGFEVRYERINLFGKLTFEDARDIAQTAIDAFVGGEVDRVFLTYNEFRSVMTQRVVVEQVLPIPRTVLDAAAEPISTRKSDNASIKPLYKLGASLALTKRPRPLTAACQRSSSLAG